MTDKRAAQRVGIGEAAMGGHLLWRVMAEFEHVPGCRDARRLNPGRGGDADLVLEDARALSPVRTARSAMRCSAPGFAAIKRCTSCKTERPVGSNR